MHFRIQETVIIIILQTLLDVVKRRPLHFICLVQRKAMGKISKNNISGNKVSSFLRGKPLGRYTIHGCTCRIKSDVIWEKANKSFHNVVFHTSHESGGLALESTVNDHILCAWKAFWTNLPLNGQVIPVEVLCFITPPPPLPMDLVLLISHWCSRHVCNFVSVVGVELNHQFSLWPLHTWFTWGWKHVIYEAIGHWVRTLRNPSEAGSWGNHWLP